jgi:hypothetical protein
VRLPAGPGGRHQHPRGPVGRCLHFAVSGWGLVRTLNDATGDSASGNTADFGDRAATPTARCCNQLCRCSGGCWFGCGCVHLVLCCSSFTKLLQWGRQQPVDSEWVATVTACVVMCRAPCSCDG